MDSGERIQRARKLRGMTQAELGDKLGYRYKSAYVRISQYERGERTPKDETFDELSEILNVDRKALTGPTGYDPDDVIRILFDLEDEGYDISIHRRGEEMVVEMKSEALSDYLAKWRRIRMRVRMDIMSEQKYTAWKFGWPKGMTEE